mmetsp:Transcript_30381/g.91996  ORF Transcript_30381/g.91996 Transcript_30381/m.91996 type:complete len:214 (-) Transcript_30381:308-949(-)
MHELGVARVVGARDFRRRGRGRQRPLGGRRRRRPARELPRSGGGAVGRGAPRGQGRHRRWRVRAPLGHFRREMRKHARALQQVAEQQRSGRRTRGQARAVVPRAGAHRLRHHGESPHPRRADRRPPARPGRKVRLRRGRGPRLAAPDCDERRMAVAGPRREHRRAHRPELGFPSHCGADHRAGERLTRVAAGGLHSARAQPRGRSLLRHAGLL